MKEGKIFIGGLSWGTTEDDLKNHFSKYGEVKDALVVRDWVTGHPRGFAFVKFAEKSAVEKAVQEKHMIVGTTVEAKKARPRGPRQEGQDLNSTHESNGVLTVISSNAGGSRSSNNEINHQWSRNKIFVGGLSPNLTLEEFKSFFQKFGTITDAAVINDSHTGKPKGFGFITFDSEKSVNAVMRRSFYRLNEKLVEVKRAVPKHLLNNNNTNNNMISNYSNRFNMSGLPMTTTPIGFNGPTGYNTGYASPYGGSSYASPYGGVGSHHAYGENPYGGYAYGGSPSSAWGGHTMVVGTPSWGGHAMAGGRPNFKYPGSMNSVNQMVMGAATSGNSHLHASHGNHCWGSRKTVVIRISHPGNAGDHKKVSSEVSLQKTNDVVDADSAGIPDSGTDVGENPGVVDDTSAEKENNGTDEGENPCTAGNSS